MLLLRSFSYTARAAFSEDFFFHLSSKKGVSLILLMLVLMRSFSNPPHVGFSEEFLLHS